MNIKLQSIHSHLKFLSNQKTNNNPSKPLITSTEKEFTDPNDTITKISNQSSKDKEKS